MGGFFAVATVLSSFGSGSLPQINSISNSVFATFGIKHVITGAIMAFFLALIIIGGIKRIAKVTERLVPFMAIFYFVGALAVILFNYQNIIPSFASIFLDLFTGTAATGGFLGAGFAFAFNQGVNRGLFSNESGQGSAPIAHAAAKAHEPVSEGMVAILEPFIDTIIICFLTGLVLLSSGVWKEKLPNQFQKTDIEVLTAHYSENKPSDVSRLENHLNQTARLPLFSGKLDIKDGQLQENVSIIHARSLASEVVVLESGQPFTGRIDVVNGKVTTTPYNVTFRGNSLIHSAPLTTAAFSKSFFGDFGKYIVSIGLLLFAFSTSIAWSYYGDRAVTYLFGANYVLIYRIVFVIAFFFASFTDTTIIWNVSLLTVAFMAIPNLFGLLVLHREVKSTIKGYWKGFRQEYPDERTPEE